MAAHQIPCWRNEFIMIFTCDKLLLSQAVVNASRAVSAKSNLPALEGVYLRLEGNEISITGYDLEVGIITSASVYGEEDGGVILNARLLGDILRKLPNEEISISVNEKLMTTICCGKIEYNIVGMPTDEYPSLPDINENTAFTMPQSMLKSMISQTIFAVATDEIRAILTGVLFNKTTDVLTLTGLDGHRLAIREESIPSDECFNFVVPSKSLGEVAKLLNDEDDKTVLISVGRKHIIFDISGTRVISRLLEGEFLDYTDSIVKGSSTEVIIKTREFIESLERASLLINESNRSPVRCKFTDKNINLSCITAIGKVHDEFEVLIKGDELEIGFNNKYLLDALKATESDEVKLLLLGPLSPMKIVPLEGNDYLFLVLPMRLKAD